MFNRCRKRRDEAVHRFLDKGIVARNCFYMLTGRLFGKKWMFVAAVGMTHAVTESLVTAGEKRYTVSIKKERVERGAAICAVTD